MGGKSLQCTILPNLLAYPPGTPVPGAQLSWTDQKDGHNPGMYPR